MLQIADLVPGVTILNKTEIAKIFQCGTIGSMRRSLKTNTLVLFSNIENTGWDFAQKVNDHWIFMAMGYGNQDIEYKQNKTLRESNVYGIKTYLFISHKRKYKFIDQVFYVDYEEKEVLRNNKNEKSIYFKLVEIGVKEDLTNFLVKIKKDNIIKLGIINKLNELNEESILPLINLIKIEKINTLTAPGGWFLNDKGYFHNPNDLFNPEIGNLLNIDNRRSFLFLDQNKFINPFFKSSLVYKEKEGSNNREEYNNLELVIKKEINTNFRLLKLEYKLLKSTKNTKIDFLHINNRTYSDKVPFISLIVGPNGTGKSTILSVISRIFLEVFDLLDSKINNNSFQNYSIEYQIGDNTYCLEKGKEKKTFYRNKEEVNIKEIELPNKVIASACSFNDRFIYTKSDIEIQNRYEYIGMKDENGYSVFEKASINLIRNIMVSALKSDFPKKLELILQFLGFESELKIIFSYDLEVNLDALTFEQISNYIEKSEKLTALVSTFEILEFIKNLNDSNKIIKKQKNGISILFSLTNKFYEKYYDDFTVIWCMYELGLVRKPEIMVKKGKVFFPISEASSGEAQYFQSSVNLLSKIEDRSLILIDEPETSLHPNWQYNYIQGMYKVFQEFPSTHFIIATHSPFMVSELNYDTSSIISIKNTGFKATLHEEQTYGWSIEEILYEIFNLGTNRNYYLAQELDSILMDISLDRVTQETRDKVQEIKNRTEHLKTSDPLRDIIELIEREV